MTPDQRDSRSIAIEGPLLCVSALLLTLTCVYTQMGLLITLRVDVGPSERRMAADYRAHADAWRFAHFVTTEVGVCVRVRVCNSPQAQGSRVKQARAPFRSTHNPPQAPVSLLTPTTQAAFLFLGYPISALVATVMLINVIDKHLEIIRRRTCPQGRNRFVGVSSPQC
jgi:hypothetical protein